MPFLSVLTLTTLANLYWPLRAFWSASHTKSPSATFRSLVCHLFLINRLGPAKWHHFFQNPPLLAYFGVFRMGSRQTWSLLGHPLDWPILATKNWGWYTPHMLPCFDSRHRWVSHLRGWLPWREMFRIPPGETSISTKIAQGPLHDLDSCLSCPIPMGRVCRVGPPRPLRSMLGSVFFKLRPVQIGPEICEAASEQAWPQQS